LTEARLEVVVVGLALASVSPERGVVEIGGTGCALSVPRHGGTLRAADCSRSV